jgi:hypothetical protein
MVSVLVGGFTDGEELEDQDRDGEDQRGSGMVRFLVSPTRGWPITAPMK